MLRAGGRIAQRNHVFPVFFDDRARPLAWRQPDINEEQGSFPRTRGDIGRQIHRARLQFDSLGSLDIATASAAANGLATLDSAISDVSALAARFGSAENRLESRSRLLGIRIEATAAADSRIRDADYALESARLARNQIIQESAIAVIGQANSNLSIVLRLLE